MSPSMGYEYVLVMVYVLWSHRSFLYRKTDIITIAKILSELCFLYIPREMFSNRGTHFARKVIKQIRCYEHNGIIIVPVTLGLLERLKGKMAS